MYNPISRKDVLGKYSKNKKLMPDFIKKLARYVSSGRADVADVYELDREMENYNKSRVRGIVNTLNKLS